MLIAELERAQLRGDDMTGSELVLAELRRTIRAEAQQAPLADDGARADQLTRALHERAIVRRDDALAGVGSDERAQRRLAIQVGTPRAAEDIATLVQILENREVLADLARRLPRLRARSGRASQGPYRRGGCVRFRRRANSPSCATVSSCCRAGSPRGDRGS